MDRDEIIKLASQAIDDTRSAVSLPIPFVMRFAALVAAAERAEREKQEPVAAQAEGYVTALRYIAWEAAGYMDCVHAAKRAIGEMGALPPPPNTQPTRGEG